MSAFLPSRSKAQWLTFADSLPAPFCSTGVALISSNTGLGRIPLAHVQDDVLRLEFESFSPDKKDTITSQQFASVLVSNVYPNELK